MRLRSSTRAWVASGAVAAAVLVSVVSCGDGTDEATRAGGVPSIVATTSIWADVASNVACGGLADVEALVPVGADPHAFEASAADRAVVGEALLVISNGLGLEGGLADIVESAESDGVSVFVATDHVEVVDGDPHIWFDPTRVMAVAAALASTLIDEAGLPRADIEGCLDAFQASLETLDDDTSALLQSVPDDRRRLLTNHDALGYFAARFGFEILGTVLPSSGLGETSAQRLAELVDELESTEVSAVFTEQGEQSDVIDALAAEAGDLDVVALYTDTLGDEGSGAETYIGMMRTDAELIAGTLG